MIEYKLERCIDSFFQQVIMIDSQKQLIWKETSETMEAVNKAYTSTLSTQRIKLDCHLPTETDGVIGKSDSTPSTVNSPLSIKDKISVTGS